MPSVERNRRMTKHLSCRVTICSSSDVVSGPTDISLQRNGIVTAWAEITSSNYSKGSSFGRNGFEINKKPDVTHLIYIRSRRDLNFTAAAWVFEERLQSSKRWYKVIGVDEGDQWTEFQVKLVERSDTSPTPNPMPKSDPILSPMKAPEGVLL